MTFILWLIVWAVWTFEIIAIWTVAGIALALVLGPFLRGLTSEEPK